MNYIYHIMLITLKINSRKGQFNIAYCTSFASIYIILMAHFHRQRQTRFWIPNRISKLLHEYRDITVLIHV